MRPHHSKCSLMDIYDFSFSSSDIRTRLMNEWPTLWRYVDIDEFFLCCVVLLDLRYFYKFFFRWRQFNYAVFVSEIVKNFWWEFKLRMLFLEVLLTYFFSVSIFQSILNIRWDVESGIIICARILLSSINHHHIWIKHQLCLSVNQLSIIHLSSTKIYLLHRQPTERMYSTRKRSILETRRPGFFLSRSTKTKTRKWRVKYIHRQEVLALLKYFFRYFK